MTSTLKSLIDADVSDLLEETPADAADVLYPVTDLLGHIRSGRAAVSDTDTHVKHLFDALVFGTGIESGVGFPGADEFFGANIKTAIAGFTIMGGGVAYIDLSFIPATYDHLRLVLGLRTADPGSMADLVVRCNDDAAAANYASLSANIQHGAALTTSQILEGGATGGYFPNVVAGSGAPAGYQGVLTLDFYEYAQTGRPRTCRWQGLLRTGNTTGLMKLTKGCFMWKNTVSALNKIVVYTASGLNFVSGSGYALYGIR